MSSQLKELGTPTGGLARLIPGRQQWPILATLVVFVVMYVAACLHYQGFASQRVFINFFGDNAFLGVAALGETLVILSGGIDLSVGSMVACTSVTMAKLMSAYGWSFGAAATLVLTGGLLFGAFMGWIIHRFAVAPFLVTLGGLFVLRGTALLVSKESLTINSDFVSDLSTSVVPLGFADLPVTAAIFIGLTILLTLVARYTAFGRNVYAVGGSEPSALLMGLPVGRTKIGVYALSGFLAAMAGVVFTIYTGSGNATAAQGMELDAIAAVVVGGTLLSGGVGYIPGTLLGVLVFGIIQTAITFQGTLSSWWAKIAIGGLLLLFIALQRLIATKRN